MPRLDRQHNEPRAEFLGTPIYPGSHGMCNPEWFVDTLEATARVAKRHEPKLQKVKVGASTGGVWLCLWARKHLPEPYNTEIAEEYLQVRLEKQAWRDRKAREKAAQDAANTPAP